MEIHYGSGSSFIEAVKKRSDTAVIGFAGAYSGGSNNAQYEQSLRHQFGNENTLIVPSASTKYAFREKTLSRRSFNSGDYYRQLATKAIDRFPTRDTFLIHCQSGGGTEGLAFTKALLENPDFHGKKIKLLFTGVPGFSEKASSGIGRTLEFLRRFLDVTKNRAEYQQYDLCPPPDEYYDYYRKHNPDTTTPRGEKVIYEDTPEERQKRRDRFYEHYLQFLSPEEKKKITQQVSGLDDAIRSLIASPDAHTKNHLKELLYQRGKLVFSIGGDRYYQHLAKQPEYKSVPDAGFDGTIVGVQYIMRLLSSVSNGMETTLSNLVALAKQKKKVIEFSFGVFEKDAIFGIQDIATAKKRLAENKLTEYVTDWLVMEGLSHESVDNSPQGIMKALTAVHTANQV